MGKKWDQDKSYKELLAEEEKAVNTTYRKKKPIPNHPKKIITGNIAALGNNVFYLGGSVMQTGYHYQKTVDKIAEYVQSEFGGRMWTLITTQVECQPVEPAETNGHPCYNLIMGSGSIQARIQPVP